MQKLRGTGTTFSTSGKRWLPFRMDPKIGRRNARLRRLMKAGKLKPLSKAEARALCDQAVTAQNERATTP